MADKPNYQICQKLATNVLKDYSNGTFPINLDYLVSELPDLRLMTYSNWCENIRITDEFYDCDLDELTKLTGTKESLIFKNGFDNIILFNNSKAYTAVRWNIAHELGHYFLNHQSVNYDEYSEIQEKEANNFARHLLTPMPIIMKIVMMSKESDITIPNLARFFGVSEIAMTYTIQSMVKWNFLQRDLKLEQKFKIGSGM